MDLKRQYKVKTKATMFSAVISGCKSIEAYLARPLHERISYRVYGKSFEANYLTIYNNRATNIHRK